MFTLSAFADEISPDPRVQVAVLQAANVRHIEFRSIFQTNVLKLGEVQLAEFKALLAGEGFKLSAVGSPVGKVPIDAGFGPHLDVLKRAIEIAQMFGTPNIRVFSYYPPASNWAGDWTPYRDEIVQRMAKKAELAAAAKIVLFHENEHNIFGDAPDRVLDLLTAVNSPNLLAAYDAANYVVCGYDPVEGWEKTKHRTAHLHIKDWAKGDAHTGRLAGSGDGRIAYSTADAIACHYDGFAVLEPHLRGGGPTGGVTGPDLFPVAIQAFRNILHVCGGVERFV